MKLIVSFLGAMVLLGTAGCHTDNHHHRGGSYDRYDGGYPHSGSDRYHHAPYYGKDRYGRDYSTYPRGYRTYPYDRDQYWHRP